jgi:two-component system, NtrC family, sensor kinase
MLSRQTPRNRAEIGWRCCCARKGPVEYRSADINALVEESLNLAYHGARADKPAFNVMLKRDPDAGTVQLYPQESPALCSTLISNGFYAGSASRWRKEAVEPVLIATTKILARPSKSGFAITGPESPHEAK